MRIFFGLLASVLAALIIQGGTVYLASLLVEMPAVGTASRQEIAEAIAAASPAAHLVTIASYLLAGLGAVWIGAAIGRAGWPGWIGVCVIAALGLVSAFLFPEPAWAQFGAPIAALVGGFAGRHLVRGAPEADA